MQIPTRQPHSESRPPDSKGWHAPWVQLRSAAFHPFIFKRMIRSASPGALPGDLVAVYDKNGQRFGSAFFNPRSQIALRMVRFDDQPAEDGYFLDLIRSAVSLRRDTLKLDAVSNAYRVLHAEADGISGLVVDRYADVLSVEAHSLAVYRRLPGWLPALAELCGTSRQRVYVDPDICRIEGFALNRKQFGEEARSARIEEHGLRFAVDFQSGHKTGFFCDQRENRKLLAEVSGGKTVLDLCCYTGGFSLHAKVLGGADEVTGVDLDEEAIDQAHHNSGLNQAQVRWVHSDAFSYARQMQVNQKQWDIVILDPPKFIPNRDEDSDGRRKYFDLNRLALALVKPQGLFVTCSCSGLLPAAEFERLVIDAAHRLRRRLQIFRVNGAGPDHPVLSNCPESRYLKVLWARVW